MRGRFIARLGEKMKSISRVIKKMGATYCCHPSKQVQRLPKPLEDSAGVNLAEKFKRIIAEREEKSVSNVTKIVVAR
jgi:hypothetical protein